MSESNVLPFDWGLWFQWIMATTVGWVLGNFLLPNLAFVTIGLALGLLQWLVVQHNLRKSWQWIIATTLGWLLGSTISKFAIPAGMDFLAGLVIGVTTGTAQWIILRRQVYLAGWWIIINIVAWTSGLAFLPGILLTGVVVGVITSIAIGLLLRFPKPISEMPEVAKE